MLPLLPRFSITASYTHKPRCGRHIQRRTYISKKDFLVKKSPTTSTEDDLLDILQDENIFEIPREKPARREIPTLDYDSLIIPAPKVFVPRNKPKWEPKTNTTNSASGFWRQGGKKGTQDELHATILNIESEPKVKKPRQKKVKVEEEEEDDQVEKRDKHRSATLKLSELSEANLLYMEQELSVRPNQLIAVIKLLEEGNTVHFIARYRKEQTNGADETLLRNIMHLGEKIVQLEARKATVLSQLSKTQPDLLTDEFRQQIQACTTLQHLEDIYAPYKPKKTRLVAQALAKGLGPLAEALLESPLDNNQFLALLDTYLKPNDGLPDHESIVMNVLHILSENVSQNLEIKDELRSYYKDSMVLYVDPVANPPKHIKASDNQINFERYMKQKFLLKTTKSHQLMALNRAERTGNAKLVNTIDEFATKQLVISKMAKIYNVALDGNPLTDQSPRAHIQLLYKGCMDGWDKLHSSIGSETRKLYTERAEQEAIEVFYANLKNLMLSPPALGKTIMGMDPGFRQGTKCCVIDHTGKVLEARRFFVMDQDDRESTKHALVKWVAEHNVDLVAVGDGQNSGSTLLLAHEICLLAGRGSALFVSEQGASVYSASEVAKSELSSLDVSLRGSVSIARRLQDPLSELVKIDAQSIGIGLYQHDVNQRDLTESVGNAVADCVNFVGVNLNTASAHLLKHISGMNLKSANNIIEYRNNNGQFKTRNELRKVKGVGPKTFTQAAGFLRIPESDYLLDNTSIHPESYEVVERFLKRLGFELSDMRISEKRESMLNGVSAANLIDICREMQASISFHDTKDFLKELRKPGRDPRQVFESYSLTGSQKSLEDLKVDDVVEAQVHNVVPFGVFLSLGISAKALLPTPQIDLSYFGPVVRMLSAKNQRDPTKFVRVGQQLTLKVTSISIENQNLALSMLGVQQRHALLVPEKEATSWEDLLKLDIK